MQFINALHFFYDSVFLISELKYFGWHKVRNVMVLQLYNKEKIIGNTIQLGLITSVNYIC